MSTDSYRYIRCEKCGQINRLPEVKFASGAIPTCGKCKQSLSLQPKPAALTDQNFKQFISAPVPTLVDFWAPWCGPCHALAPTIEKIAQEFAGQILVGKLNTDENTATASGFQISGIPTVILFRDGREVDRLVGVQPKTEISRRIQSLLR
jgi:thioredoxin